MTHTEFWELYNEGRLGNVKIWRREEEIETLGEFECDGFSSEIISFTYEGKFFLRIVQFNGYETWFVGSRRDRHCKRVGIKTWSVIKEFDNKVSANSYFKKCSVGYKKADGRVA